MYIYTYIITYIYICSRPRLCSPEIWYQNHPKSYPNTFLQPCIEQSSRSRCSHMQATSSEFVWCAEGCWWVATILEYVEALEPPCGCLAWNGRHFDLRPSWEYWLRIQKLLASKRPSQTDLFNIAWMSFQWRFLYFIAIQCDMIGFALRNTACESVVNKDEWRMIYASPRSSQSR